MSEETQNQWTLDDVVKALMGVSFIQDMLAQRQSELDERLAVLEDAWANAGEEAEQEQETATTNE